MITMRFILTLFLFLILSVAYLLFHQSFILRAHGTYFFVYFQSSSVTPLYGALHSILISCFILINTRSIWNLFLPFWCLRVCKCIYWCRLPPLLFVFFLRCKHWLCYRVYHSLLHDISVFMSSLFLCCLLLSNNGGVLRLLDFVGDNLTGCCFWD